MSANDLARSIAELAVHAPSGDNAQPWEFRIRGNSISLYNIPERDATLYNYRERGSYLSHGAVAENICIIAASKGYGCEIRPFPGPAHCTAEITLAEGTKESGELFDAILRRATNRKPYRTEKLGERERALLTEAARERGAILRFAEGDRHIARLAGAISCNERVLFEHRGLHDFLFNMIRWTTAEEKEKPGLYVKTMEFPPPLQLLLRYVFKHWNIVQALNAIGLSKFIPKQSSQVYRASAAIGAIVITDKSNIAFFQAGRAFQRVWLTATKAGLSLQPVTAIPYLAQRVSAGDADMFTDEHQRLIEDANAVISNEFSLKGSEHIAMLFRIGSDGEPTARSAKMPPRIV